MKKIKALIERYREIILYLVFGVLTTAVGWGVYFTVFYVWKAIFSIPASEVSGDLYMVGYTVAQIVQWIAAVLFAFFTNRKWVFTDAEKGVPIRKQLPPFAAGRVVTLGIDYLVTWLGGLGLALALPSITHFEIFGRALNLAEIFAKVIAAVIVIICNYIFSKVFVFKKKKSE